MASDPRLYVIAMLGLSVLMAFGLTATERGTREHETFGVLFIFTLMATIVMALIL